MTVTIIEALVYLVSVRSKLLSIVMLFRLRDAVDKYSRKEQCGFIKGRGSVDQIFTLRLIIQKCLSHQTRLVLNFIYYEPAFESAERRA